MSAQRFIPFNRPSIGPEEIAEVTETLRSGWLTTGSRTARFEKEFATYTGSRHSLAVSSCTAGLHLALAACGIGPGDEVITTPLTFCATVITILHTGATPVLADVGEDGNLDPESVAARITPRTKAIVPVHLGGLPCQMDAIWSLARQHGLRVIEDAAHALGTTYRGRQIGSAGDDGESDVVAFSFYATKNITTGEGGMVTTNSADLAARMKRLALHGISKDGWDRYKQDGDWYYEVIEPGFKYNLSDIQSAIGIHQLRKIEQFTQVRARYAELYNQLLGDLSEINLPPDCPTGRHCWHLYSIRLNLRRLSIDRAEFIRQLRRRNIGVSVHFIPIQLHPFFAPWAAQCACPRSLELYERLVSLPLYPAMTEDEVEQVARAVRGVAMETRRVHAAATLAH